MTTLQQICLLLLSFSPFIHASPLKSEDPKAHIKILCTSALIPEHYEERKNEFIQ